MMSKYVHKRIFSDYFLPHYVILCIMKRVSWPPITHHQAQNTPSVGFQGVVHQSTWLPCAAQNAWPTIQGAMCLPYICQLQCSCTTQAHQVHLQLNLVCIKWFVYLPIVCAKFYITPVTLGTFARWACLAFRRAYSSRTINICLNDLYSTNLAPPVSALARSAFCRHYRGRLARLPSPQPSIVRPPNYLQDVTGP